MGLLFQHPEAMLFNPTVRDEIAYTPQQLGRTGRVEHWVEQLGLAALLDKPPYVLSGGEKQKVALACVLAVEPSLLLLDEPTANLDPRAAGWLVDHLLATRQTAVVSTHNLSMAAMLGCRCLVLGEGGRLLFDGPIQAALADIELLEAANLAYRHGPRYHGHGCGHAPSHAHDRATGSGT